MWEWLKRRLESLVDNLIFAGIVAGCVAVPIAMKSLPLPIIVLTFTLIFVIILVAIRFVIPKFLKNDKLQSLGDGIQPILKDKKGVLGVNKQILVNMTTIRSDREGEYPLWAGLRITNPAPNAMLEDVKIRIVSCLEVIELTQRGRQDVEYHIYDRGVWSPVSVLWSKRDVFPESIKTELVSGQTKTALIAYCNDLDGRWPAFNSPISPKPPLFESAKIGVEITSQESILLRQTLYIKSHPNYTDGTLARFELAEWDEWANSHNVIITPSASDKGDFQTE